MEKQKKKTFKLIFFVAICFAFFFGANFLIAPQKIYAYDENYEACILDENMDLVQNYVFLSDAINSDLLKAGHTIKLLKDEMSLKNSINVNFDLSIICDKSITIHLQDIDDAVLNIKNSSSLNIIGDINFEGDTSQQFAFLTCENGSSANFSGLTIKNFKSKSLVENSGEVTFENSKIVENNAEICFENNNNLALKNVSISCNNFDLISKNTSSFEISNCEILNNFLLSDQNEFLTNYLNCFDAYQKGQPLSFVYTENDFVISGTNNLIFITVFLDRTNNNECKIKREKDADIDDFNGNVDIVLYGAEDFSAGDIVVQTSKNDSLVYNLLGSPKINNTTNAYFLNLQDDCLVVRGSFFDIEYNINSITGGYEIVKDESLPKIFEYGQNLDLSNLEKDNFEFVGWFGFNENSKKYFDKNNSTFEYILDDELNTANALSIITSSMLSNATSYVEPLIADGLVTFGKLNLYSKWQCDFVYGVECEDQDHQYIANTDGGTVNFNNTQITQTTFQKKITVGESISFSAKANKNYVFVGWYQNNDGIYTEYKSNEYIYSNSGTVTLAVENCYFDLTNLVARFAYKTSSVLISKILIDENGLDESIEMMPNSANFVNVTLLRDGQEFEGIEHVNFVGSQILLRQGEELRLQISPDTNYRIFESDPIEINNMFYTNDILDVQHEISNNRFVLTIRNSEEFGNFEITLLMQKNYRHATLKYGTNLQMNNFEGADVVFEKNIENQDGKIIHPAFNTKTNTNNFVLDGESAIISKTCDVYFSTDIVLMFNTLAGYRLEHNFTNITYESIQDFQDVLYEYIYQNGVVVGIKIYNVIDNINISLKFYRVFDIQVSTNVVTLEDQSTKVGQIRAESNEFTYEDIYLFLRENDSIYCETAQMQYEYAYEFKHWQIKTKNGEIANYDILQISQEDLFKSSLNIKNVYDDLLVEAIYGKKIFNVDVICADTNGNIEAIVKNGQGYFWEVEYGDNIKFKFTPKSEMYVLEIISCSTSNVVKTESSGVTYIEFKNVNSNQRLEIRFAPNTIYKHMSVKNLEGDGTREVPYLIKNANDLALASYYINNNISVSSDKVEYPNAFFRLEDDIELSEEYFFVPLGNQQNAFNGVFDYNYHSVQNILIEETQAVSQSNNLFGIIGQDARIIRQFKSALPLNIGIGAIAVVILVAFFIVFRIEKRRQKPKKVFVIQVPDDEKEK